MGSPSSPRLARSAGIIGTATLTSRLLGLVRDQVLAYLFGAGNAMDAFNVAYRIPNLMRDLFAEGAMSAAFVPTFTKRLTLQGKPAAWRVGNQLVNALLVVTGALVLLGIVFAEPLARLLAGSYADVPMADGTRYGKLELTVVLTRIMLPFLTLVAVAAAVMGMLNSLNRFFAPALSPAMFNVGIIASAVLLVPLMPRFGLHPITAIAIGAIIGGVGQIVLQLPSLYREGYRYRPELNPADPGLREILRLIGPGTIAGAAVQINLLVNMVLATGEGTGAVSWLSYAFRVMYLPIGIFGVSIATATLPAVARHAAQNSTDGIRKTISHALQMMLVLNVPALVGLIVLAAPIVGLIFERGSFLPSDTAATTAALVFYAPGLVGYSAVRIAVPCFYAMGSSLTPTLVSVGSVVLNIALNLILVRVMGFRGLALGTSIAAIGNALVLYVLLHRRLGGLEAGPIIGTCAKISVAAMVMGGAVWMSHMWLLAFLPGTDLGHRLIQVFGSIAVGLVTLAIGARVLRIAAWDDLRHQLLNRRAKSA
ncbi:MAG: murein biosynthesis integral membrane protein MurJ [Chloroflexi bacterium]|nr:murein biosynthesis integral membrane protein MurJ [Chloroflexota bacterium]